MTAGLETFAKVRALHDRTINAGEKAAAAGRMKKLAQKAGMTVAEAVSKLDAPAPPPAPAASSRTCSTPRSSERSAPSASASTPSAAPLPWPSTVAKRRYGRLTNERRP